MLLHDYCGDNIVVAFPLVFFMKFIELCNLHESFAFIKFSFFGGLRKITPLNY